MAQSKWSTLNNTSRWSKGLNFTTASALIAGGMITGSDAKVNYAITAVVMPNPNTGNFTIQMQLPKDKAAATTLQLYNNVGVKIWQEDLGTVMGSISKHVYLVNKLAAGIYMLMIQRNDMHYTTKIVVGK